MIYLVQNISAKNRKISYNVGLYMVIITCDMIISWEIGQLILTNLFTFKRRFQQEIGKAKFAQVTLGLILNRLSACLVVNLITVYTYGFLFNCTTVGQASDPMMTLT